MMMVSTESVEGSMLSWIGPAEGEQSVSGSYLVVVGFNHSVYHVPIVQHAPGLLNLPINLPRLLSYPDY